MELKFDANQEYQVEAVAAVADLLEGQPFNEPEPALTPDSMGAVPNRLDLDESTLLANLRTVQGRNGITPADELARLGDGAGGFANFSVEMETGTGKTYVYLRTVHELFERYGLRKYIVVVPSVAVREGVIKTLQITADHFALLYGNQPLRYYEYSSDNLSQVRQFAQSPNIEVMVMTIDSFNKAQNVIHQSTDRLMGDTPISLVRAARPILILDEPQNMESEKSVAALGSLSPLFALRYSATHRNPYNLVYRLTPIAAYRQELVKRIEVASVVEDADANRVFLRLDDITSQGRVMKAKIAVHKLFRSGQVKETVVTVGPGDSLEAKADRSDYAGYTVHMISMGGGYVTFKNGEELYLGQARGADTDALFRQQIRYTIQEHFDKQRRLKPHGIKVLSLFFIDRVANYVAPDGLIRRLFDEEFDALKSDPHYSDDWGHIAPDEVRAAYFAQKRRAGGIVEEVDSSSGKNKEDEEAYDLIMRSKERLLSFGSPSFIFSHSALREGWDNPNVFQICTLNQTVSDVKKRQEVGRGMRLCVDQSGERVRDKTFNVLTVVANESYERYVAQLQAEITEEFGSEEPAPPVARKRDRRPVLLRRAYLLDPDFQKLWQKIQAKTRYTVNIKTAELLDVVVPELERITVTPPRITAVKAAVHAEGDVLQAARSSTPLTVELPAGRNPLPNVVDLLIDQLARVTPPVHLTRSTLLEMVRRAGCTEAICDNPFEWATRAARILKEKLADQLVRGISYEKTGDVWEMSELKDDEGFLDKLFEPAPHSVYDHVLIDSEVERTFAADLEKDRLVILYLKLPGWFLVDTPVGGYNPDWAIVMRHDDGHGNWDGTSKLYLMRETKATSELTELRPDERRKIEAGKAHFRAALGMDYDVVVNEGQLP